jgi:hypothetical protein
LNENTPQKSITRLIKDIKHNHSMTAIDDLFRNIIVRRPALQRWSSFADMLPILHDVIELYYTKYKKWCRNSLPFVRKVLNEIDKYFNVPLNNEVNVLLSSIEALFKMISDYLYDILIAGKPTVELLSQDPRMILLLNKSILGLSIDQWMKLPLAKLIEHIIDHTVFIHTHKKITNTFIHHRLKLVLHSFASSRSADELVKLMQESDVISTLLPLKKIMTRFATNYWLERDVYFEVAQSLLVIPQELILCINNEQFAQRRFDQEQRALFNQRMKTLFGGKTHTHRKRKSRGGHPPTGPDTPDDAPESYQRAKQNLQQAEDLTAQLVEWYRTSTELAQHQKHKKQTDHATSFARFKRRNNLTDEQQQANENVNRLREALHKKFHLSQTIKQDQDGEHTTTALSLLDFSCLEIGCACLSPLHIYHKQWSGTPRFVALIHHLHMLDLLFTGASSMPPADASNYCRHLKDIPLLSIQDKASKCFAQLNQSRQNMCCTFYGLNENTLPRDKMIQLKQCNNYTTIKQWAKRNKQNFKELRKKYKPKEQRKTKRQSSVRSRSSRRLSRSSSSDSQ